MDDWRMRGSRLVQPCGGCGRGGRHGAGGGGNCGDDGVAAVVVLQRMCGVCPCQQHRLAPVAADARVEWLRP